MNIEFVTHCWRYSRLLCYQLSSFALFADKSITVTIFYAEEDTETKKVVDFFIRLPGPMWQPRPLSRREVCRRTIGRNIAALESKAEWIWFADCDYWFGAKLFATIGQVLSGVELQHNLVYPSEITQSSQEAGDKLIELITEPNIYLLCSQCDNFAPHGFKKAIGGVQIVRGDWARINGYCKNHPRYNKLADRWANTKEDIMFRKDIGNSGFPITLPEIVRVRHGKRGGYGDDVIN